MRKYCALLHFWLPLFLVVSFSYAFSVAADEAFPAGNELNNVGNEDLAKAGSLENHDEEEKFKFLPPKPFFKKPFFKKPIPIVKPIIPPKPIFKKPFFKKPIPIVKKPFPKPFIPKPIPFVKKPIPFVKKPFPIPKKPFFPPSVNPTVVDTQEFFKPKPFFKKPFIPKLPFHPKIKKPLLPPLPIHKPIIPSHP